ncbi:Cytochrome P450 monooxygenase [Exophiala dermatitidis]
MLVPYVGEPGSSSLSALLFTALGLALLYVACLVVYRVYFHPLAKFPGPKLAAATLWYEFYYDVVKRGQFTFKIKELHQKYGPIIRINPHEIHVYDPAFYDELYTNPPRKRDKYQWWVNLASAQGSMFSTVPHNLHRLRRSVLNPYFSKANIFRLEPVIMERIEKLSKRLADAADTEQVVRLDVAFMALTTDTISLYAFGLDPKYLDEPDFSLMWKETIKGGFETGALCRQFPWLVPSMKRLPPSLVAAMNAQVGFLMQWQNRAKANVQRILNEKKQQQNRKEKSKSEGDESKSSNTAQPQTMFHALRDSDLPSSEKSLERLCDEAEIVLGAGSETTAATLSRIWFYLLQSPSILARLRAELRTIIPSPDSPIPKLSVIERLPYLSAVISEGLRISYSVTTRTPRIAPNETLHYKDWPIPPGTPVSMTNALVLMDPDIFPDPDTFNPDRWLEGGHSLEKYQVAFSKGSRQCLGMNLAYAEMYLSMAALWSRFDFELFETTLDDVLWKHDFFTAFPDDESKGVRVKVRQRRD